MLQLDNTAKQTVSDSKSRLVPHCRVQPHDGKFNSMMVRMTSDESIHSLPINTKY